MTHTTLALRALPEPAGSGSSNDAREHGRTPHRGAPPLGLAGARDGVGTSLGNRHAAQRRLLLAGAGALPLLIGTPTVLGAGRPGAAAAGFYSQPLDDAASRLGFALTDTRGRLRRSTEFADQVLVLFFGFLSCPSICPTTMLELSAAQRAMGSRAERVTIAFATLDPERDTPSAIEAWLAVFGRRHLGLRDSPEAIRRAAATLRLEYTRIPGASPASYTFDHGVQAYVFDPRGRLRLLLRPGPQTHEVAADWRRLLDGA